MYITDVTDLYRKAQAFFGSRGKCLSIDSDDGSVELLMYGTEVFHLNMPEWHFTSLSFQYEVSSSIRTQQFFGDSLSAVENRKEDVERAFSVIENFARLHLPDKYLAMYDSPPASEHEHVRD